MLTFIPQSDLSILDPIFTAAYVTRHHGMMVFDTLDGMDSSFGIQPQMAGGQRVEDDGLTWLITLRDDLRWHDGERVLARDCAASIRRWGVRGSFGQTLMTVTDEVSALRARSFEVDFDLKRESPSQTYDLERDQIPAQTSLSSVARGTGQTRIECLRDDAGTFGGDRSV